MRNLTLSALSTHGDRRTLPLVATGSLAPQEVAQHGQHPDRADRDDTPISECRCTTKIF
jgi:hypothetical protein